MWSTVRTLTPLTPTIRTTSWHNGYRERSSSMPPSVHGPPASILPSQPWTVVATKAAQPKGNVPALRFPEFSGEWENCLISDFGVIITGNTPPTKDADNYKEGIKLWASPIDLGKSKWIYDTQTKLSVAGFDKTRKLPEGAILVTCIGSTIGKMGMATCEMATNQQINSIVTNSDNDKDFVYYAIESNFQKYLASVAVQAVPIISKSSFERLPNRRTTLAEQTKIGKFLSLIDKRIETQNKIIEKLETLIKGIIETVISSQKPTTLIKDCLECNSSILQESQVAEYGAFPVYGATGITGYTETADVNGESILIIKDGSGVGTVKFVTGEYSYIGTLNRLIAKDDYHLKYIYFALLGFNFEPYKTGMAIPHIYFRDYGRAKIFCPTIEKQFVIAQKLSSIEDKVSVEKQILFYYQAQKSYLLSQMLI